MTAIRPAGCSVFLVEDEVMIRMMVADMLEELGHSVAAEAGEIGEAVKLAQSTEFDLAILDGEATPVGGMGIAKQLKDEIDDCPPILVLTGRPDDAWLARWSRAEAAVPHPIDPIRLGDAVVSLLRPAI